MTILSSSAEPPYVKLQWQGTFVSSGASRLLSLKRSALEKKLGPLQAVIDQAGATRARGQAMKEKDESLVASDQVFLGH